MNYCIQQLPNKRWGIYAELNLLASIGSYETALKILNLLQKKSESKPKRKTAPVRAEANAA